MNNLLNSKVIDNNYHKQVFNANKTICFCTVFVGLSVLTAIFLLIMFAVFKDFDWLNSRVIIFILLIVITILTYAFNIWKLIHVELNGVLLKNKVIFVVSKSKDIMQEHNYTHQIDLSDDFTIKYIDLLIFKKLMIKTNYDDICISSLWYDTNTINQIKHIIKTQFEENKTSK